MFDLGWPELFVVALVALVVLGPKELPGAIRTVSGLVKRARGLAREFHKSIDEMARESGIDEVKRDLKKMADAELDDAGAFSDPFKEADRNKILNPTNGSKLPKPATNGATSEKAETATDAQDSKSSAAEPAPTPQPTTTVAEPQKPAGEGKENGRA